jgi:hypothetical protein
VHTTVQKLGEATSAPSRRCSRGSTPGPASGHRPRWAIARLGYDLQLTRYDERGWPRDLLHDRDGALADERHRHRVGANAMARDAAGGGGRVEEAPQGPLMAVRLNGWQRLWVVLSALYLLLVAGVTILFWPTAVTTSSSSRGCPPSCGRTWLGDTATNRRWKRRGKHALAVHQNQGERLKKGTRRR